MTTTGGAPLSRRSAAVAIRADHIIVAELPEEVITEVSDGRWPITGLTEARPHQAVTGTGAGITGGWIALTLTGRAAFAGLTAEEILRAWRSLITDLPEEAITQVTGTRSGVFTRLAESSVHQTVRGALSWFAGGRITVTNARRAAFVGLTADVPLWTELLIAAHLPEEV